MNYYVRYLLDDEAAGETFEADNPGSAFALALRKYPKAKLVGAEAHANFPLEGIIRYDPPPVQRAPERIKTGARKPRKKDQPEELGF